MANQDFDTSRKYSANGFSSDRTLDLFRQPDVLCVNEYLQIYQAKVGDIPEKRLVMAILRDAIDCYTRDCLNPERQRGKAFRDADAWFFKAAEEGVFTLNHICAVLRLDPGYIRRGLRQYKEKHSSSALFPRATTRSRPAKNLYQMAS